MIKTLEAVSGNGMSSYPTALVHAGLGEPDAALEWLERAYNAHDVHLALRRWIPNGTPFARMRGFLRLSRSVPSARPSARLPTLLLRLAEAEMLELSCWNIAAA